MKKTVEVKVPAVKAKPATTKKVEEVWCDVCSEQISSSDRHSVCTLCKRDIHRGWNREVRCHNIDERDYSDYPDVFCIICWELKFKKYDKEYWDVQDRHGKEEEKLDEKIKKESLGIK